MKGNTQQLLLVSDDKEFYYTLGHLLSSNGLEEYEIICAHPLEKALDLLDEGDFSLVLFDLPKETADTQMAQRVRSAFGKLTIIMISSLGIQQAIDAIRQGFQQVVDKNRIDHEMVMVTIMASLERSRMENELRRRDEILEAVNYAAEIFLTPTNWNSRLTEILERLGKATEAERVRVYRIDKLNKSDTSAYIFHEWRSPEALSFTEKLAKYESISLESMLKGWGEQLKRGEIIVGDQETIRQMEVNLNDIFPIGSFIWVPIFNNFELWGLITFEHYRKLKAWSVAEMDAVKTSASMIGAAIGRQEAEEKMKYLATHDHLTGLPNRLLFTDRFQQAVARAVRSGEKIGVICLDLDKFKLVNDTYGHPIGDQALVQVGKRLCRCLRGSDTCARIGGDEFGFIADSLRSEVDLTTILKKLMDSFREEVNLEGKLVAVRASMGASLYPEHGTDLEALMSAADKALYQAKRTASGYRIYKKGEQYPLLR